MYRKLKKCLEDKYGITEYEGHQAISGNMIGFGNSPFIKIIPLVYLNFHTFTNNERITKFYVTLNYYCGYASSQLFGNL